MGSIATLSNAILGCYAVPAAIEVFLLCGLLIYDLSLPPRPHGHLHGVATLEEAQYLMEYCEHKLDYLGLLCSHGFQIFVFAVVDFKYV